MISNEPKNHSQETILTLRNIVKRYGSQENETFALQDVSLTVRRGDFLAILGSSGAGKSTLLNIVGLLDIPTAGTYLIGGVEVSTLNEKRRNALRAATFGFVFQSSHVMLRDTAARNVALGLSIQGVGLEHQKERVFRALQTFGMVPRAKTLGKDLSGGERQRVAVARAIATDPQILLADEPTGALDTENTENIIEYFKELNAQGVTIIVITHDPIVAAAATRQLVLTDGIVTDKTLPKAQPDDAGHGHHSIAEPKAAPEVRGPKRSWATAFRSFRRTLAQEFYDALSSHNTRPGRAVALLLAFMLGTGGLVASVGISQSAAQQVSDTLTQAALDEVIVTTNSQDPSVVERFYVTDSNQPNEVVQRIERLEGVTTVGFRATLETSGAPIQRFDPKLGIEQLTAQGSLLIADAAYLEANDAHTRPAAARTLLDNNWGGKIAILGEKIAESLGITVVTPGTQIWIGSTSVDVVGIIHNTGRDPVLSDTIVFSRDVVESFESYDARFIVRTESGYPAPLAEAIPTAVSPGNPGLVNVATVADLRNLRYGVNAQFTIFITIVSWILLILSSLSAATSMHLSVIARTSEIALRRAIGSSRSSIWRMFAFEGLTIGFAGGVAGSLAGTVSLLVITVSQGWSAVLDPKYLLLGVGLGMATGGIAALYPSFVASRLNPADAIRQ